MIIKINTNDFSADVMGEKLRSLFFVNDGNQKIHGGNEQYKQLGCCETFEVRKSAVKITGRQAWKLLCKFGGIDWGSPMYYKKPKAYGYRFLLMDKACYCCWYWDGDGTLLFVLPDRVLINTDCKKTYGWEDCKC